MNAFGNTDGALIVNVKFSWHFMRIFPSAVTFVGHGAFDVAEVVARAGFFRVGETTCVVVFDLIDCAHDTCCAICP